MNDSLTQFNHIILGKDNGQNPCDKYDRLALPTSAPIVQRAYAVRQFFSAGWFRLWRQDVLNQRVTRRDSEAFAELQYTEKYIKERESIVRGFQIQNWNSCGRTCVYEHDYR
jgi:hypothetical protein